ncbi:MAG: DUF3179 domain-containing protein [Acidiferrobacterales bacterium]|nr:DUF3179 domain-containing protein [Acidiferrobacterales bacterium]
MKTLTRKNPLRNLLALSLLAIAASVIVPSIANAQLLRHASEWPNTDFSNAIIDINEVISGGVPKDGIPAIDDPEFVSVDSAAAWLDPLEPVIALDILGEARAYPLQILIWHEIVNDKLNDRYVAVTFCPLCNASVVFDRNVVGTILDFGTTGRLRHSDLIMYDRQTESWWQQITGQGVVGEFAGINLKRLPAQIVSFGEFRSAYPEGEVLSRDTGYRRNYGDNPYRGYDDIDNQPFLLSDPADPRLPAMERVINVSVGNRHRVYPFTVFETEPVINDRINGIEVVIFSQDDVASPLDRRTIADSRIIPSATAYRRQVDGQTLTFERQDGVFYDRETGSRWNIFGQAVEGELAGTQLDDIDNGQHFAFAWLVFHPDSEIYRSE